MSNDKHTHDSEVEARSCQIYQGYDTVTGNVFSKALKGKTQTNRVQSMVKVRLCSTKEEMTSALEINQSLSLSVELEKVSPSMKQRSKFVDEKKVTSQSLTLAVYAQHITGTETNITATLEEGIDVKDLKEFVMTYGDSFLSSVTRGGDYYAFYMLECKSTEHKKELTLALEKLGASFRGATLEASFESKFSTFRSENKEYMSFDQRMSGVGSLIYPVAEKAIEFALAFPSKPMDSPEIISFETQGYERVPGIGRLFGPVQRNRETLSGGSLKTKRDYIAELGQLKQLKKNILFVKQVYASYGDYKDDIAKLNSAEKQVEDDLGELTQLFDDFATDPTDTLRLPAVCSSLTKGPPMFVCDTKTSAEFGGIGATDFNRQNEAFNDVLSVEKYLNELTRIKKISLHGSKPTGVFTMRITYACDQNEERVINHGLRVEPSGNTEIWNLELSPGEFVTCIKGYYLPVPGLGTKFTKLVIGTSDGRELDTKSDASGTSFEWKVPEGHFVMGFAGSVGLYLNKFEVIYGRLRSPKWKA